MKSNREHLADLLENVCDYYLYTNRALYHDETPVYHVLDALADTVRKVINYQEGEFEGEGTDARDFLSAFQRQLASGQIGVPLVSSAPLAAMLQDAAPSPVPLRPVE